MENAKYNRQFRPWNAQMKNCIAISAFKDNYIWAIANEQNLFVVDPGDAQPVVEYLESHNLQLSGILLTHHHHDHSGGIDSLQAMAGNIPVYGSHKSTVKGINHPVKEGDVISVFSHEFNIMEIPGHTLDHIAFFGEKALFCGDTLFSAGCGRIFEGTAPMMFHSVSRLAELPSNTRVFCGHEYTLANLAFAKQVEPNNTEITVTISKTKERLETQGCSLPSTLGDEQKINPFFRCGETTVREAVENFSQKKLNSPEEVFAQLREWKNVFRAS